MTIAIAIIAAMVAVFFRPYADSPAPPWVGYIRAYAVLLAFGATLTLVAQTIGGGAP